MINFKGKNGLISSVKKTGQLEKKKEGETIIN